MKKIFMLIALTISFLSFAQNPDKHKNGVIIGGGTTDPVGVSAGQIHWDSDDLKFRKYDGTVWSDLIPASQLSDLTDVNTSTPTNRNVLVADGVDFESRALVEADISDLGTYLTTEVDGSVSNELQTIANTSAATTHTTTLSNSGGSTQFVEGTGITLTTSGTGLDGIVTINTTGLESLTETTTGWRFIGANPANYGDIGNEAIDFSKSLLSSSTFGATGEQSIAFGEDNTSSGYGSFTQGYNNIASDTFGWSVGQEIVNDGYQTYIFGYGDVASGSSGYSGSFGAYNNLQSLYQFAGGLGLIVKEGGTTALGIGNTDYTPDLAFNGGGARRFVVGNGTMNIATPNTINVRSDAFVVLQNGTITAPSFSTAEITTAGNTALITKEYGDANYLGGASESTSVTDTAEIDLTLTGSDITADIITGSIDVLKLDSGVQTSLGLADTALQTEVDGSVSNEGSLTVGAGTGTTSIINSNTSGSTGVTLTAGTNMTISEVGNVITLDATGDGTGTDSQTLSFSNPNLSITGGNSVDISAINTDTQLTNEQVQDKVGGMVTTTNTETLITVTYQDATGDIDFVVDNDLANYSNATSNFSTGAHTTTLPIGSITGFTDNSTNWNTAFGWGDHSGLYGDVTKVGTPVNNQIGVWTGDGTLEGNSSLTFDSSLGQLEIGMLSGEAAILAGGVEYISINDNAGDVEIRNGGFVVSGSSSSTEFIDSNGTVSLTGAVLNLSDNITGKIYNEATPSTATAFTTIALKVGGFAYTYINSATEPTVNGSSTKSGGSVFEASTVMKLVAYSPDGTTVEHFFVSLGTPTAVSKKRSKSISIIDPVATDDITMFFTPVAISVENALSHITGATNVVFNINHSATRTGTPLDVYTSDITLTSTAGQSNAAGFNDATIPANSWVWLDVVSVSGTPTAFSLTLIYKED
jgi:hypothetical protein